jgi:folate-binding protein YgfZ
VAATERLEKEYRALRESAGWVEVGREFLTVSGRDALSFLQSQCSQDLAALGMGDSTDTLVLEPQGKLVALVRATLTEDETLLLDTAAGYAEALRARLERFKLRVDARIEEVRWRCVAVRGASASAMVSQAAASAEVLKVPFSWNGVVGVDLLGLDPRPPAEAVRCSQEALESLRVEAGIPEMGKELDERTIPAEADLLERCVSFTKGCYTGQELVARLDARGNRVARRLRGLIVEATDDPREILGAKVRVGEKVVGHVTAAAWSPALGSVCALGYLHRDVAPPQFVEVLSGAGYEATGGEGGADAEEPEPGGGETVTGGTGAGVFRAEARELPLVV